VPVEPMVIDDVTADLVDLPAEPEFRWRTGLPGSEPSTVGAVLRVRTTDGLEGIAFTRRGAILSDIVARRIRGELKGQDAWRREYLWQRMWELDRREDFPSYILGLVDVALWDLAGKALGMPVHRLLGGFRESIPAYASTVTYDEDEEYLDVSQQICEAGYRAIKIHGRGDAVRDAELCLRLRSQVGPTIALMYDGSAGYNLPEATYLGKALGEAGFTWYEEPMREFNVTAYRWLAERVDVPLLVAETSDGAHMKVADFLVAGCASYVRTGATYKAGVTGALRIAHLAESFLVPAEVHQSGIVSQHLCMAIPNTTYYESRVIGNPIVREGAVDSDGFVHAPTGPGFGFDESLSSGRGSIVC
jgi:L-alanine-DL-glutamate epimerase-like enolase superfamily enzyme